MKKICTQIAFVCALFTTTSVFSQNISEKFETQSEINSLMASCWTFNNFGFTSDDKISGRGSVESTLNSASELITPELQIPPSLTISFSYNTVAVDIGSKTLKVLLVINGVETILESIDLDTNPNGNFSQTYTSANTPGNNINGSRKIIFRTTDNASVVIDNLTINAPYTYPGGCSTSSIILPVKFSGFSAKKGYDLVALTWSVSTEQNVAGYEIQKSTNGNNFSKIGFVHANDQSSYTFTDNKISEVAFYRIKSIDNDSRYIYSTIVSLKGQQSNVVMKAFPTPVRNELTLQHSSATNNTIIEVSSADGRMIKSVQVTVGAQQSRIDLSSAKGGVYIVRFSNNNNIESLKIIKQ